MLVTIDYQNREITADAWHEAAHGCFHPGGWDCPEESIHMIRRPDGTPLVGDQVQRWLSRVDPDHVLRIRRAVADAAERLDRGY